LSAFLKMGTQRLGLGPDSSFDSEEAQRKARDEHIAQLVERLFESRIGWTILPTGLAVFAFLWDWGGYRGNVMPWGDPRPLDEIWWHLPLFIALAVGGLGIVRIISRLDR
jgi:hypothetical protein